MNDALRRGWCPGALRPMAARDGLLVRLRLTGGKLDAARARALAALASYYGNGLFDLSARANLQMRGVDDDHLGPLLEALADLGLLDADPDAEAVRNVLASPLAGLNGAFDVGPLVAALEAHLVRDRTLHALPGKFGFLVDDGGEPSLAGEVADVRFDIVAVDDGVRVWVGLGGTRDNAVSLGFCAPGQVVDRASQVARTFLSLASGHEPPLRRMRPLIERLGPYQTARAFGAGQDVGRPPYAGAIFQRASVGVFQAGATRALSLAAPFGRLDAAMLRAAADHADRFGQGELRLTPWRCILVPGLVGLDDLEGLQTSGYIVDDADPRLRVAACVGKPGCPRGTTATREDAAALAEAVRHLSGTGVALHVSGCEKGCARAARTAFTLVGRDGRYDLVQGGRAGDAPVRRDLDIAAARAVILAAAAA